MAIRLRKDERELIVAALEEDYDSPEGAATAIFSLVAGLLAKRDSFAVRVAWGSGALLGPMWDLTAAKKVMGLAGHTIAPDESGGAVGVSVLRAPAKLLEANVGPLETMSDDRYCEDCGHPWFAHIDKPWVKPKGTVKQPSGCSVPDCGCRKVS